MPDTTPTDAEHGDRPESLDDLTEDVISALAARIHPAGEVTGRMLETAVGFVGYLLPDVEPGDLDEAQETRMADVLADLAVLLAANANHRTSQIANAVGDFEDGA